MGLVIHQSPEWCQLEHETRLGVDLDNADQKVCHHSSVSRIDAVPTKTVGVAFQRCLDIKDFVEPGGGVLARKRVAHAARAL